MLCLGASPLGCIILITQDVTQFTTNQTYIGHIFMTQQNSLHKSFNVSKKRLHNGLTILAKKNSVIPRVEVQLWYNVGSKHEESGEKGLAHLIEHMMFKGTKKLSESDINLITHKLGGQANAFTTQDYTSFTFTLPSNAWHEALPILAECMQHATFNAQMLASEVKAVIEELRMYRDDHQNSVLEKMIAAIFPEHPYHYPIIGSKHDLCNLDRDALMAFYKKHYHPNNATLVIVGDIDIDNVFELAEKYFGNIPAAENYTQPVFYFDDDIESKSVTLYRQTSSPWSCYMYKIPGILVGKNHIFNIASLILASGKSSRLYKKLVEDEELAIDVDSFIFDFFERGLFGIAVYPKDLESIPVIEKIIEQELVRLATEPIEDWEFSAAKKRVHVDYTTLLEDSEKQAETIGASFLATNDENFIETYLHSIEAITKEELQAFFLEYTSPSVQHKGYLLVMNDQDKKRLEILQKETDQLERVILAKHIRTEPIEPGKWANTINTPALINFTSPKPESFTLDNGLDVIYYNNPAVGQISGVLSFKANYFYEEPEYSGVLNFLLRLLTDQTAQYSSEVLNKILEINGLYISPSTDHITLKCLTEDLKKSLEMLFEMLTNPKFDKKTIEKLRMHSLSELDDFWDTPLEFADQLAKDLIYKSHPYSKNSLGTRDGIKNITPKVLQEYYQKFISPQEAILVLTGDLNGYNIKALVQEIFRSWHGPSIPDLVLPALQAPEKAEIIVHQITRDQIVLGFTALSIARTDPDYLSVALLDIILTGGSHGGSSSRLFALRELEGLFYAIGGSLLHNAREAQGMVLIKTIVSADKAEQAQNLILKTIENFGNCGITDEEFSMAKNLLLVSSADLFDSNTQMAYTFLFLKKFKLSFDLFDKQGVILSILKIDKLNELAKRLCAQQQISIIKVGSITEEILKKF